MRVEWVAAVVAVVAVAAVEAVAAEVVVAEEAEDVVAAEAVVETTLQLVCTFAAEAIVDHRTLEWLLSQGPTRMRNGKSCLTQNATRSELLAQNSRVPRDRHQAYDPNTTRTMVTRTSEMPATSLRRIRRRSPRRIDSLGLL
jgi:hypothetical protein